MKRTNVMSFLAALLALPVLSFAQPQLGGTTLLCRTADGDIVISSDHLAFRDYSFRFDSMADTGVVKLVDCRTGCTAVLDLRSSEGLYIAITEGSRTMQMVVVRTDIKVRPGDCAGQPASSISSDAYIPQANLMEMIRSQVWAATR